MAVDLAALRAKLAELKTGQKTDAEYLEKYVILQEGETLVRILPGKGEDSFYAETAIHRINGRNIHCIGRKVCPICKYVSKLYDSKDDANVALARRIKSKKRFYFNVIVREYKNPTSGLTERDVGPKIFSCGIKLFEKILSTFVDDDFGDLTDLGEGWDFKIIKKEKDGFPNYDDSRPRPKQSPAGDDLEKVRGWMDRLHDLQALIVHKTIPELQVELNTFLGDEGLAAEVVAQALPQASVPAPSPSQVPVSEPEPETPTAPATTGESSEDDADDFLNELRKLKDKK